MRGRPSFLGGYRILLVDLASSSASDGDALTLDLGDPVLRALLRELRLVVLVEGAADKLVAADRPPHGASRCGEQVRRICANYETNPHLTTE